MIVCIEVDFIIVSNRVDQLLEVYNSLLESHSPSYAVIVHPV
jgi:hypothetical protein